MPEIPSAMQHTLDTNDAARGYFPKENQVAALDRHAIAGASAAARHLVCRAVRNRAAWAGFSWAI